MKSRQTSEKRRVFKSCSCKIDEFVFYTSQGSSMISEAIFHPTPTPVPDLRFANHASKFGIPSPVVA